MDEAARKELIREIIDTEFGMFDQVHNEGGRADCQDNRRMFDAMRGSQFLTWDGDTLASYREDLAKAVLEGRNLLSEKYAFMMADTDPEGFAAIRDMLPEPGETSLALIRRIMEIYMRQTEEFMERWPAFLKRSRPMYAKDSGPVTSIETYMRGELMTYSQGTLACLLLHMEEMGKQGVSMVYETYRHTAEAYGFKSVEEAAAAQEKR